MSIVADVRLAFRHLRHAPGYALAAVLTLTCALAANTAIFSAVQAVLLRPLPMRSPANVAVVWQTDAGGQAVVELTHRHLREWTADRAVFESAAVVGSHNWSGVLQGRGEPARIWFAGVSASFFDTLGVTPFLGRTLGAEDDVANGRGVAVLSYDAWVRRFGADPAVVNAPMTVDGEPVDVVGVMPPGFEYPRGAEFWIPIMPMLATGTPPNTSLLDGLGVFYVVGRLRPGVSADNARTAIDALERRLDQTVAGRPKWGERAVVTPFVDHIFGPMRPALWALWAAVGVLLLIACANVSGLMIGRVADRRREHAVRLALGATRASIGRLWIAEVCLIALAGGAIGLLVASVLLRAVIALAPDDLPRLTDVAINVPVAAFTFAVMTAAAVLTGLIPMRHAARARITEALEGARTTVNRSTHRTRSTLIVAQLGLAVVLLVAAGLVVRSFVALQRIDLGFTPDRVLTAVVQPRGVKQPANVWLDGLIARVRMLPGVESAGAVYLRPLMLGPIGQGVRVYLEGQPETQQAADANPTLNHQIATPGYFEAIQIPLRRGRSFTAADNAGAPRVAIVSESTARRLWPGQDPIGRRLLMATFTPGGPPRAWRTVVGVVSDVRYRGLGEAQLDVYDPALQVGRAADNVVIRTTADPLAVASSVRALARELGAGVVVDSVTTMSAAVGRAEAPWRFSMWLFTLFGLLACGLAALGLFSVVALDVANRRREFAIRVALGAPRGTIVRGVLARASVLAAGGLALGLTLAWWTTRAMQGLLFGVTPGDPITYVVVVGGMLGLVAIAAWLPARRASRAEPSALLRS